jgi:uncharacterized membrane protein
MILSLTIFILTVIITTTLTLYITNEIHSSELRTKETFEQLFEHEKSKIINEYEGKIETMITDIKDELERHGIKL